MGGDVSRVLYLCSGTRPPPHRTPGGAVAVTYSLAKMSILPQIIEWSRERPRWQQDALRRLAEQPHLTETDLAELVSLCRAEHGIAEPDAATPQPFATVSPAEAPAPTGAPPTVRLKGIHGARNVNALRSDQALTIATRGLTVVYGDNGAGKSGYVRVLKQVCRARGTKDTVHPNVFEEDSEPATAVVTYELEVRPAMDGEAPAAESREIVWTAMASSGAPELAQVSVFDTRSASVYVNKQNEVAYLPHGTDLFPKLVSVCDAVKLAIESEMNQLERDRDRFETIPPDTVVYDVLQSLHTADARARVDQLATLTDADRARLEQLRGEEQRFRADDPIGGATERRQCSSRLAGARVRLAAVEAALDESAIRGLQGAYEALVTARTSATLASDTAFASAPLAGVGSEPWRLLWDAARRFATEGTSPTQAFPPPADSERALCVLCQQELTDDAKSRLIRFEEFIRSETRMAVDRATAEMTTRVRAVEAINPRALVDTTLLEEIRSLDMELAAMLHECIASIAVRRDAVIAAAGAADRHSEWESLISPPSAALTRLALLEWQIGEQAAQYEAAVDPISRKVTKDSLREIEARVELGTLRERVYAEIERQQRRRLLRDAVKSTATASITRQNTEVLRDAVSEPLAAEFSRQIKALNLTHLPISVDASQGQKGRALHGLSLGVRTGVKVATDEVLSEGEHRCTALAAFLAEISLQDSDSTVVFDDPVSSLDHARRGYVARRIVEISQARPVVVFTHDLAFLWMLHDTAEDAGASLTPRYLRRDAHGPGLISEQWPWDGLTVKSRVGVLKNELVRLKKLATNDRPAYEREVRLFYGMLRDTWERSVEEILLNSAVKRFKPEVETLRLRNLHRITAEQMATFTAGMSKSSKWIQGHDHATLLALPLPEYDEVSADLATFEQWTETLRKQNNLTT
jgi:energy-coupling factor transporter ATP-binding protein EcfA2